MEAFSIVSNDQEFRIEPTLHEGMFKVRSAEGEFLIGKSESGEWDFALPDSQLAELRPELLGAEIERTLNGMK